MILCKTTFEIYYPYIDSFLGAGTSIGADLGGIANKGTGKGADEPPVPTETDFFSPFTLIKAERADGKRSVGE
jgi:hypothetical protein